jgi:predicted transposase/invertase (TIGR01784 family)
LVNASLEHAGKPPVHALELRNPFNIRTAIQAKESILDIRAKDSAGGYINLEVQLGRQSKFFNRVLYYWAKIYSDQLARGDSYRHLLPVISINLTAHTLFPDLEAWHTLFHLTEENQPGIVLCDDLNIHFVEVHTINLNPATLPDDKLIAWCFFLRYEGVKKQGVWGRLLKSYIQSIQP